MDATHSPRRLRGPVGFTPVAGSSEVKRPAVLTTLQRGLRMLEAVAEGDGEATARSLNERTGVRIATCYHLLRTLQQEGYVARYPGGRYGLGERLAYLHDRMRARLTPLPELAEAMRRVAQRRRRGVRSEPPSCRGRFTPRRGGAAILRSG